MDYSGKIIKKTPVTPSQTSASGVWQLDEAMQAVKSNTWPVANVPNPISRSLRFRQSASAYLTRTPAVAGNRRTWTWSGWIKWSLLNVSTSYNSSLFNGSDAGDGIMFWTDPNPFGTLHVYLGGATYHIGTNQVFRDPSAWYHIVVAVDTTQATDTNRIKLYVNGSQVTSLAYTSYPTQNYEGNVNTTGAHYIAKQYTLSRYYDGYMTEVNFIDGQQLTPSSFGGTNAVTGVWEPRQYTGTYGTNGFYLNFKDNTSTTTLGYDYSGNNNTWTTNNISLTAGSTYDSMLDVPTQWVGYNTGDVVSVTRGNYCTLNPLVKPSVVTLSEGNLTSALAGAYNGFANWYMSSGKWYWEVTIGNNPSVNGIGISSNPTFTTVFYTESDSAYYYGDGSKYVNGSGSAYGASFTTGDVIGFALDVGANTLTCYKNNSSQGSISITSGKTWTPSFGSGNGGVSITNSWNFGQRPFSYTPPSGYLPLCTTNLSAPTILQGNQYMDATLYTGTGANATITNSGSMQPDLVWVKVRSTVGTNVLTDAVRGANKQLFSNLTNAEASSTIKITGFTSTGFTLGADDGSGTGDANYNGSTYVGWQWRASNAAAVSNVVGTITSSVSASTTSGFSIVTYTGNGVDGATVGHGIGVKPSIVFYKRRDNTSDWLCLQDIQGSMKYGFLNGTSAFGAAGETAPTSSVLYLSGGSDSNASGATYVAYCFASVAGYSKLGSYTGNGSSDGTFVYTGFRPKFVLIRRTDSGNNWFILDSSRNTYNLANNQLYPNASTAEGTNTDCNIDIVSNGFKLRTALDASNGSGGTYIYMAFAESPFKNALAR